jgi:2-polyprenyl-6-methoxyphenol hydroxylase-like FAD-dependent oxidoreductase
LLIAHLDAEGITVERRTTITSIGESDGIVVAQGNGPDGVPVTYEARFLAGCDGSRSVTRVAIGVRFPGTSAQSSRARRHQKDLARYLDGHGIRAR